MSRHRIRAAIGLLCCVASGCAAPTSPIDERALSLAEARWSARGFDAYTYETVTSCGECAPDVARPTRVVVRGRVVTGAIVVANDSVLPTVDAFTSVDGLFEQIRAYRREGWVREAQVEYDPQLGYPTSIDVTAKNGIVDGDYRRSIRNLVRTP